MSTAFQLERPRIVLVIEDEPVLRASMVRGLGKLQGIEVVGAGNVREAKELVSALDASLVISDLDLPDGSGVEIAAEIERLNKRVPIVFATAFVRKYQGQLPKRADIEVQEKPVSLTKLREIVARRLGGEAMTQASPFSVADFVQLAAMGRRSVVLEVRSGQSLAGAVLIRNGDIWSAHDRKGEGMDAFRRLVFMKNVRVECRTMSTQQAVARTIEGSAEHVLLEAAQALDEGRAPTASLVPAPIEDDDGTDIHWPPEPSDTPPEPPPESVLQPAAPQTLATVEGDFRRHYERAIDALLSKDFRAAHAAFVEASRYKPEDPSVIANLQRLRDMGHGGSP